MVLLAAPGCDPGRGAVRETIVDFARAVQDRDLDRLYCLVAGAAESPRAGFAEWADARYRAYEDGRDGGRVELDGSGVALVKLFALGKGTYFESSGDRSGQDGVREVDTDLRFGYAHLDLSGFSPGTTLYVAGAPAGRVHALRVPEGGGERTYEVLDAVRVRWTMVFAAPAAGCAGGWTVASAEPVPGTERTVEVSWIF